MSQSEADDWGDVSDEAFASLVADIEDPPTAKSVKSPKHTVPLETIRWGHIWVSDLSSQIWCEQKLVYKLTLPMEIVQEPEHVTVGKSIHLARELEVQDSVRIRVTSREDKFAIKLINLLTGVESFHLGNPILREVPVFGLPFDSDVFVTGIVDELRLDVESFEIDVVELKTRREKSLPCDSTTEGYRFQVMLYKMLLDNLIKGKINKQAIAKHLKLKLDKEFGEDVLTTLRERERTFFTWNLNKLFDDVLSTMQTIPCPNNIFIEYCSQADNQTFHLEPVTYNEEWLSETCQKLFQFWKGQRKAEGVNESNAWKCGYCDFADICVWRKKKAKQLQIENTA